MLRLAFDFIIAWREIRARPNAYLSSNALQGLTHVNKAVYVCRRFYLQLIACLFTRVSP